MKTNKQKCLEMWEWLRDNPEKDKEDYREYLQKVNKEQEFNLCWACIEAMQRRALANVSKTSCTFCPITWGKVSRCFDMKSAYFKWVTLALTKVKKKNLNSYKVKHAQTMIKLIKTTWPEEEK